MGFLPASLISVFTMCLAPSAAEAEALRKHTKKERVIVTGPLTDTAIALQCDEDEQDRIAELMAGRPVWLSAGTTDGDLAAIEAAHRRSTRAAHRLLLIVTPAEPDTGPGVARWFEARGWRVACRSLGEDPAEDVQVFVADAAGEAGLWYRIAPVTFLAGTLHAGRTPLDPFGPAALGSAVIHGPAIGTASARFDRLRAAGATRTVTDAESLGETVYALLSPEKAAAMAHAGWLSTTEGAHVVEALAGQIDDALARRGKT